MSYWAAVGHVIPGRKMDGEITKRTVIQVPKLTLCGSCAGAAMTAPIRQQRLR